MSRSLASAIAIRVTATAEFAGYDTSHKPSDFAFMKAVTQELYPEGADYDRADMWAGLRPMTPNNLPLFGRRRFRNLFLNTGHGHIGWTMSHGSAQDHRRSDRRTHAGHVHGRPPGRMKQRAEPMSLAETAAPSVRSAPIDLGVLPSELDGGVASRAAIGLVVLATDQTMEHEFRALVRQPGVAFYESRVFNDNDINPDTLRAIGPRIAPSVDLILPSIPLDVVAFGCTSATMTLGEDAVFAEIRKVRPNVACTTPVTAALAAFRALGAKKIGLLTPYAPQINDNLVQYFSARGVDITAVATFDRQDDREAARITVASIEAAAERFAATSAVDAIFVSCTSLRVAEAVAGLEQRLCAPITSSNHAMAWHCLRLAGVDDVVPGAGRLFELTLV